MRAPASVLNKGLYFELEFALVCLLLSFQSLDCNSVDSIGEFHVFSFSNDLVRYKTLERAVPSSIHSSRTSGSSGSKTQKGPQKTQTPPPNIQAILLTHKSQNWFVSKCIFHKLSEKSRTATSILSSNNNIFGGKEIFREVRIQMQISSLSTMSVP